jgi:putative membrane protein
MPPAYGDINSRLDSTSIEDSRLSFWLHLSTQQQSIRVGTRGATMAKQKSVVRGVLAGMAGGLAAAWVMNVFITGPGKKLQQAQTAEGLFDAGKEDNDPIVHYAVGALTGGVYGGLAEYSTKVTSGFGTSYGGVLFSTADLLSLPALNLGPSPTNQPASALATPFAAHIIYGATTEFVRRILRAML